MQSLHWLSPKSRYLPEAHSSAVKKMQVLFYYTHTHTHTYTHTHTHTHIHNAYVHTHPTPHTHSTHNHTHTTHTKSLQPQAHPFSSTQPHLTTDHPLIITITTTMQFKGFSCLPSITRDVQTQLPELQATLNPNRRKISTMYYFQTFLSKDDL